MFVYLELYDPSSKLWYHVSHWTLASAGGSYTADFHSLEDIKPLSTMYINVYYYDVTTGNETVYERDIQP